MSVAEYALHRGVSESYVRRMRRKGHLAAAAAGGIDAAASDALLDAATNPVRGGKRPGSGRPPATGAAPAGRETSAPDRAAGVEHCALESGRDPGGATATQRAAPTTDLDRAAGVARAELPAAGQMQRAAPGGTGPRGGPQAAESIVSVHEAVRRERLAKARLAELELGQQSRRLTRVDLVERAVFTLVRRALNQLQGMSGRLATSLAAEADAFAVAALLDADIANICAEMRAAAAGLLDPGNDAPDPAEPDADDDADADTATALEFAP